MEGFERRLTMYSALAIWVHITRDEPIWGLAIIMMIAAFAAFRPFLDKRLSLR